MNPSERSAEKRVKEVWPEACLVHFQDGAVAVRVADAGGIAEYIGWGQVTVSRDSYQADSQAWADAASKLEKSNG